MRRREFIRAASGLLVPASLGAQYLGSARVSFLNDPRRGKPMGRTVYHALPTSGLKCWLKPESLTGVDGSTITTWADSSGNGNDATGVASPTVTRTAFAGYAGARCLRTSTQYFTVPSISVSKRNCTLAVVYSHCGGDGAAVGNYNPFWATASPGFAYLINNEYANTPGLATRAKLTRYDSTLGFTDSSLACPVGPALLAAVCSAANVKLVVDSDSANVTAAAVGTVNIGRLGFIDTTTNPWSGDCFEAFIWDHALDSTELAALRAYVVERYGPRVGANIYLDCNSWTAGTGCNAPYAWGNVLNQRFGGRHKITNNSLRQITTATLASQAAATVDPYISTSLKPNVCCILEIHNHIAPGVGNVDATTAYNAIVSYCQARQAAGWKVIVGTCPDTSAVHALEVTRRLVVNQSIRDNWATFADAIADIALDAAFLSGRYTDPAYYDPDNIHFTEAGEGKIADYFQAALATLGVR